MARILVVDDHPRIVRLLQRELEAEAHEVGTATTGEAALHQIRQQPPDLVVLDVMLPGMDGFELLQTLKADPATHGIVVILLTAKDHPGEMTHGLQIGADWYVTKPFHPGDIASLARRFLEGPHRRAAAPYDRAMLPIMEIDLLTMTVADALDQASQGNVPAGSACLAAGLRRAREVRASGEPWADELVRRYEEVLHDFAEGYCAGRA